MQRKYSLMVRRSLWISLICLSLVYTLPAAAEPRNLTGRLGVGFSNQLATDVNTTLPMVSAKYYLSKATAMSLGLGFDTRSGSNTIGSGLKFYQNLFLEDNLFFYTGLGLGFVSKTGTKLQASAYFGTEFFFSNIPSLGWSVEAGIRGDSYSGNFAIRTIGDSFITGGVHFYF
jgi:hypothetical protein